MDTVVSTSSGTGYHFELSKWITLCTVNSHCDNSMLTALGNGCHPAHVHVTLLCTHCLYAGIGSSTLFSYLLLIVMCSLQNCNFAYNVLCRVESCDQIATCIVAFTSHQSVFALLQVSWVWLHPLNKCLSNMIIVVNPHILTQVLNIINYGDTPPRRYTCIYGIWKPKAKPEVSKFQNYVQIEVVRGIQILKIPNLKIIFQNFKWSMAN